MSNVKTIDLTGGETEINFETDFKYFWIQNLGSGDIYASTKEGIVPGMDRVTVIGAGASARISDIRPYTNTLYLMGKGKVQVVGDYTGYCPFKADSEGGDSGGGGGGGSGTEDYNKLNNLPTINGKTVKDDMTFEQLGWYALTKEDAANIVKKAFDKIKPFTVLAEIPLQGSFDGYGYNLLSTNKTESAFTEDAIDLSNFANFSLEVPSLDIETMGKITVSFEIKKISNSTSKFTLFANCTNNIKYYWYIEHPSNSSYLNLTKKFGSSYSHGSINIPTDDFEWHTLTLIFSDYMRQIKVQWDDNEPMEDETLSPFSTEIGSNVFYFNKNPDSTSTYKTPYYLRNIKVMAMKGEG